MLKKIYQELVAIRKELQSISNAVEFASNWIKITRNRAAGSKELSVHVDKTIERVCDRVQKMAMPPDKYADTVKALAELVKARALLD